MNRLLFVTQNLPYPTNSGSRLRTANLIRILSLDHDIRNVFLISRKSEEALFRQSCPQSIKYDLLFNRERGWLGRAFKYLTSPVLKQSEFTAGLQMAVETIRPNVVWLDYLFIGNYIALFKKRDIPVIYGTHNAQASLTRQQASVEKYPLRKVILYWLSLIHVLHERLFLKKANAVVCVSKQDLEYYAKFLPRERIEVVPNFVDADSYKYIPAYESNSPYICFVGSLDNFQNNYGIKHFIKKSWGLVSGSVNVKLLVIGRGARYDKELRLLCAKYDNIRILGDVESVVPYIKGALVSIVPIMQASGTRLKIIESMAFGAAIVSTALGAQGINAVHGVHLLIAEDPIDFADQIIRLVKNEQLRRQLKENAYKFAIEYHGLHAIRKHIKSVVHRAYIRVNR